MCFHAKPQQPGVTLSEVVFAQPSTYYRHAESHPESVGALWKNCAPWSTRRRHRSETHKTPPGTPMR
jgi:hypothetical protein